MNNTAIKVEGLSKRFIINSAQQKHKTFREALVDTAIKPYQTIRATWKGSHQTPAKKTEFWALRDISFEVKRGEVVGVIGRNGAGKSTLLKILSRITEPSTGYADIFGRVGSLLEVGTGFHPELSGRENIYLNGAILGMKRAEIDRQFDQIVSFAEVENFIDTPVKHYSSGMYLRLAFAVAAHLEPDILLVDEVLAVGDATFQNKCLGKMNDVAKQGRTVLFVSHNMSAIKEMCEHGILLDVGKVVFQGASSQCITHYYSQLENQHQGRQGDDFIILGVPEVKGDHNSLVMWGDPFYVTLPIAGRDIQNAWMFFIIEDHNGRTLVHSRVNSKDIRKDTLDGDYKLTLSVPPLWLSPGLYSAHFKFLVSSTNSSGKVTSEKFMIEVHGEFERTGKAVLNPAIDWSIR